MRIQASHMNLSFMQQLQKRKNQGDALGSNEDLLNSSFGSRLASGLKVDEGESGLSAGMLGVTLPSSLDKIQQTDSTQSTITGQEGQLTLGGTVANEVIRRLESTEGDSSDAKDSTDLQNSLGQALDWVRQQYGDEAGAAAAGMMLSSTASGVTEDTLGDGLLDTLKFIDRNFGVNAGDATIAKFNSTVNADMNEYFENGLNEVFHASTSGTSSATGEASATRIYMRTADVSAVAAENETSIAEKLMENLQNELEESAQLQDLSAQLEADFEPSQAVTQSAIAAYQSMPMDSSPQFTSTMV